MFNRYRLTAAGALIIALLATLLYLPFLHNAVVFDDHGLFTNLAVYDYAQTPFDYHPRTFPYFTLGIVQVLIGSIEAQRIVSLILHILCAWMLFALLIALLRPTIITSGAKLQDEKQISTHATILAFIGATWFVLNPIAVYGAGYLAQRTILFATFFSILSLWYYRRAFAENRTTDVITAALFYSAAVFSKEHAIMLPAAAVALTTLYKGDFRSKSKRIGLYLLLCLPAAITAVLFAKQVIASSYEPDVNALMIQLQGIPLLNTPHGRWLASIALQTGFFFDYAGYWIIPDIRSISADMRIDFAHLLAAWWLIPKALLFLACPIAALYLLKRGGWARLFGCGLLYSWLLFFTELASVRFQEPFVLYRSYLWAPGYVLMLVALFGTLPLRWVVAATVPIFAMCFWLAHERLTSLASDGAVWKDAALKLQSESLVGSDRIFYNRGLQYIKDKKYAEAIADFSRVIPNNPKKFQIFYVRGNAYYGLKYFNKALADFDKAILLNPHDGLILYGRGLTLEQLGCMSDALNSYKSSAELGIAMAKIKIMTMSKNNLIGIKSLPNCPHS